MRSTRAEKPALHGLYNSATHLLGLINDFLDFSGIESGKMEVSTETSKIQDVVFVVVQSLSPMISEGDLRLVIDILNETPEIRSRRK